MMENKIVIDAPDSEVQFVQLYITAHNCVKAVSEYFEIVPSPLYGVQIDSVTQDTIEAMIDIMTVYGNIQDLCKNNPAIDVPSIVDDMEDAIVMLRYEIRGIERVIRLTIDSISAPPPHKYDNVMESIAAFKSAYRKRMLSDVNQE